MPCLERKAARASRTNPVARQIGAGIEVVACPGAAPGQEPTHADQCPAGQRYGAAKRISRSGKCNILENGNDI